MSLTSYRTAPPRGKAGIHCPDAGGHPAIRFDRGNGQERRESGTGTADAGLLRLSVSLFRLSFPVSGLGGPGGDLLSHALGRSTIGAAAFHDRVRNGIGWDNGAMATRSAKTGSGNRNRGSGSALCPLFS